MVAPITGPIPSSYVAFNLAWSRSKYKQAKPVTVPLPYTFQGGQIRFISGSSQLSGVGSYLVGPSTAGASRHIAAARLQAYESLRGKVSDRAQLGAAIAEAGKSCQMIYSRMKQIVDLIRAVKRLDLSAVSDVLEVSVKRTGNAKNVNSVGINWTRSFANNWLELSFGWVPLIGDVYSALEVLSNPIKSLHVSGTGSSGPITTVSTTGSKPSGFYTEDRHDLTVRAITGCEVTINNPNLYLLNNLGLANPGLVLWELIPFSFVLDWVANVSEFLSSGTDWLGLGITNSYNTYTLKGSYYQERRNPFHSPSKQFYFADVTYMERATSLYSVPLTVRPMNIPHWKRAANMAATAVQLLNLFGR